MSVVGVIGAVALGTVTWFNHGWGILAELDASQWGCLLGAAVSNPLAFLFLTRAFKLLPITYVNATNLAQIAMAALVGVLYFSECFCPNIWLGLSLMAAGYVVLDCGTSSWGPKPFPKRRSAATDCWTQCGL